MPPSLNKALFSLVITEESPQRRAVAIWICSLLKFALIKKDFIFAFMLCDKLRSVSFNGLTFGSFNTLN